MLALDLELEPFVRFFEHRLSATGIGLADPSRPRAFLNELVSSSCSRVALDHYAQSCPVAGAGPDDYSAHLVHLSSGCRVLARIHFRGLSSELPFVDVSAQSAELPHPLERASLIAPFAVFRPRAIRVWQQGSPRAEEGGQPDQLVLAGRLDQLLARPLPAGAERVALEPDSNVSCYADYLDGYTRVRASSVTAREAVPEPRESLRECARANAFFRVRVDGEPAGFIAARPGHFRIHAGWEMVDELLFPEFQGQGLGPAMQRVFLQSLERARAEFVFGTIAAANAPSLRTALRVGRSVVESGVFFGSSVGDGERV